MKERVEEKELTANQLLKAAGVTVVIGALGFITLLFVLCGDELESILDISSDAAVSSGEPGEDVRIILVYPAKKWFGE